MFARVVAALAVAAVGARAVHTPVPLLEIDEPRLMPEGVVWNPHLDKFLVSSLQLDGNVWWVDDFAFHLPFITDNSIVGSKIQSTMRMHIDDNNLWIGQMNYTMFRTDEWSVRPGSFTIILADATTSDVLAVADLTGIAEERRMLLQSITTDRLGNAYIADAYQGRIYQVTQGGVASIYHTEPTLWAGTDEFDRVGITGLVMLEDETGEFLLTINYSTGRLYRLRLDRCLVAEEVRLDARMHGHTFARRVSDMKYDADSGNLYMVGKNPARVYRVRSDDGWRTHYVDEATDSPYPEPSSMTLRDGYPYIIHPYLNQRGRVDPYPLYRVSFPAPAMEIPEPHAECSPNGYLCEDLVNVHLDFPGSNVNNCLFKKPDRVQYFLDYSDPPAAAAAAE